MNNDIILEYKNLLSRKLFIEKELTELPRGYITYKTINGKTYDYLQYRVNGKVKSEYLRSGETERIAKQLSARKEYEDELPGIAQRLAELEQAARLISNDLGRTLMLLKCSIGMDELDRSQKEKSISFANAMNAIEGVPVSSQTSVEMNEWKNGKVSFLTVYEATLKRYGFENGGTI